MSPPAIVQLGIEWSLEQPTWVIEVISGTGDKVWYSYLRPTNYLAGFGQGPLWSGQVKLGNLEETLAMLREAGVKYVLLNTTS